MESSCKGKIAHSCHEVPIKLHVGVKRRLTRVLPNKIYFYSFDLIIFKVFMKNTGFVIMMHGSCSVGKGCLRFLIPSFAALVLKGCSCVQTGPAGRIAVWWQQPFAGAN